MTEVTGLTDPRTPGLQACPGMGPGPYRFELDSGTLDSGTLDSGTLDSGTLDSGTLDSGTLDSGTLDSEGVITMVTATVAASPIRLRLRPAVRKLVLLVHIMSAGSWLGLDVAMAVAIFTALNTDDTQLAAALYGALETITVVPLLATGIVCLITGLFLGWGSKYGVLRYWWVLIKLILNLILTALVVLSLRGGMHDVGEYGARLTLDPTATADLDNLIYPPIVSPLALTIAMILSVFKPWRRIRRPSPPAGR